MENITPAHKEAFDLYAWITINTNDISIPNKEKEITSATIFQQSMDIGDAILILIERNLPGPAFALARTHFETYICGIWLLEVASPSEVSSYHLGICPKIDTLVKKVYKSNPDTYAWVKNNRDINLKSFHGLAHSGIEHSTRRISNEGGIEPTYQENEILNLIKHSTKIQIGIAIHLYLMIDNLKKMQALIERANKLCIIYP